MQLPLLHGSKIISIYLLFENCSTKGNPFIYLDSISVFYFPLGFKTLMRPKNSPSNSNWQVDVYAVDYNFFSTLNLSILAGRKISSDFPSDTLGSYVIIHNWIGGKSDLINSTAGESPIFYYLICRKISVAFMF